MSGENALLADRFDLAAFEDRLGQLLEDRGLRVHLAAGARETALSWTWGRVLDDLLLTYASYTLRRARAA